MKATEIRVDVRPDPRCQHEHDPLNPGRKCDSRCNEASAAPWHCGTASGTLVAHAWCLPMSYRQDGWRSGVAIGANVPVDCEFCSAPMAEFPR